MIIFRTLPVASSVTVLVLAMLGVCATPMGWLVSESIFVNDQTRNANPFLAETAEINRSPYRGVFLAENEEQNYFQVLGLRVSGPRLVFHQIVRPFQTLFKAKTTAREFLYYLFGSAWTLAVWSFFGLGIARVCVLRLARNEQAGLDDAFDFSIDKFVTCFSALAMPLVAVFGMCIPMFVVGLFLGFDLGTVIVGLLWFVVLAISAIMGILLLGLMFSWPLIVSSVATEGQNAFDAMTRAYAYTFQRPIHYLFYMMVAVLFGGLVWLIAGSLANGIIDMGYWSTSWGANRTSPNRIEVIKGTLPSRVRSVAPQENMISQLAPTVEPGLQEQPPVEPLQVEPLQVDPEIDPGVQGSIPVSPSLQLEPEEAVPVVSDAMLQRGRKLISFWEGMLKTVATAFIYGLFWCMASAIYLLLRRDVDETEMDEVYLVDERRTYDLPPLQSDADGIPQVQPLPRGSDGPAGSGSGETAS